MIWSLETVASLKSNLQNARANAQESHLDPEVTLFYLKKHHILYCLIS